MQSIKIKVTQKDIDRGIKGSVFACPLALAASRKIDGPIKVGEDQLGDVHLLTHEDDFKLPLKAVKFYYDFDTGRPVRPFTFTPKRS